MGSTLQALRELQDVELQIVDIRRQLARRERFAAAQAQKLESVRGSLQTERDELKRGQAEVDALDLELKTRNANVNRMREHLNTVRTNKEYATVLSALNNEKADATRLEGRAIELMEKIDTRKKQFAERERQEQQEAARLRDLQGQLEQAQQSFASRLTTLEGQRDQAAEQLSREVLDMFNRVSERYEGEVMARVTRTHPRRDEFICEGCNMSLAAERANALLTRDDVITCDNCGRILHMPKST